MPIRTDGPAPYAPPKTVLSVIQGYRDRGLQTPFTLSVLERAGVSSSLAPRTLQALKLLDLTDEDGQPTAALVDLGKAGTDEFPARLAAILRGAYEEVFQYVEPRDDSPERVRDAFRVFKPRGQQGRMVTLFLGLCEAAGIIDKVPKRRPATRTRTTPPARKKPPTQIIEPVGIASEEAVGQPTVIQSPPPPPPQTGQHPFIRGLFQSLPEVGTAWPRDAREKWTRAALAAFDLIYELPPEDRKGGDGS